MQMQNKVMLETPNSLYVQNCIRSQEYKVRTGLRCSTKRNLFPHKNRHRRIFMVVKLYQTVHPTDTIVLHIEH